MSVLNLPKSDTFDRVRLAKRLSIEDIRLPISQVIPYESTDIKLAFDQTVSDEFKHKTSPPTTTWLIYQSLWQN
jgi:hypothetical protein